MNRKRHNLLTFTLILIGGVVAPTGADEFTIDMVAGRGPRIQLDWIDTTNGNVLTTLTVLVDSGNLDGDLVLTPAGRTKLGVARIPGGGAQVGGLGAGGAVRLDAADLTVPSRSLDIKGLTVPDGQARNKLSFTGRKNLLSHNVPGLNVDGIIGQDFLDEFNETYNKVTRKAHYITKPQWIQKRLEELREYYVEVLKPIIDAAGSVIRREVGPYLRPMFDLGARKEKWGAGVPTTFDFGFWYERPILSETTAQLLDLERTGSRQVTTPFGDVLMDEAQVYLDIEGDTIEEPVDVFIVSDYHNPDNVNLLPAEVLWGFHGGDRFTIEDYDEDETHYHFIHLVPEPMSVTVLGLAGLVFLRRGIAR